MNFRKNFITTKNSYNIMKINNFKIITNLLLNNNNNLNNHLYKKYFSKKITKNYFENISFNEEKEEENKFRKKTNYENPQKYLNNFTENKKDDFSNNLEKKFDKLFQKTNISNDILTLSQVNSSSELTNHQEKNEDSENFEKINLENFKKYIMSTLFIPKTDFNERLVIKDTELNHVNKITEDYYIKQLGIFQENSFKLNKQDNNTTELLNKSNQEESEIKNKNKLWITHDVPSPPLGNPHLSQLMNKVLKDAINRIKNLQGYRVIYKIGFECYGVELENFIFKKINKKKFTTLQDLLDHKFNELSNQVTENNDDRRRFDLERSKSLYFREQCRKYIDEFILEQKEYFKRLGIMSYYNHSYSSHDKNYEKKQIDYFQELYEKGLILRDYRKILWSEENQKIIEYEDLEEKTELNDSIIVKFPIVELSNDLKEIKKNFPEKNFYFLGFLTEPYKYVGIQALSINDDADYCLAELAENDIIICSYKRLPEICKRANLLKNFKLHFVAKGWAFKNLIAKDPIFNRKLPIISDDNVSVFFGTGINILSPAHDNISKDEEETKIARKYNLSLQGFIDDKNNFCKSLGFYFYNTNCLINGNKKIINKLKALNSLMLTYKYENIFYSSKKTGERITVRTVNSWFLKIDEKLKNQSLKELSLVKFFPELTFDESEKDPKMVKKLQYMPLQRRIADKKTNLKDYFNVIEELESISEWCISEVNSWGIPIPYFMNISSKEILMDTEIINHVKNLFYEYGSDIWFKWDIQNLLPEKYKKDSDKYITGIENFDRLFDSALSWHNMENLSMEEKDVLSDFENYRNMSYVRELTNEFNKIKSKNQNEKEEERNIKHKNTTTTDMEDLTENSEEKLLEENKSLQDEENSGENTKNFVENPENLKQLIPEPLILDHLANKTKNLILNRNTNNNNSEIFKNEKGRSENILNYDIIIEGKNQHSLWLLMSCLSSISFSNFNMYKSVLTHGYILDSTGKEISEKNLKDALDIIDGTYKRFSGRDYGNGADSLRLYFLKHSFDLDYKLFEEDILKAKGDVKFYRKISKICLGLLNDYDVIKIEKNLIEKIKVVIDELDLIDQTMYFEFIKYYDEALRLIENYNISEFLKNTFYFMKNILNDYYMDSAKFTIVNYKRNDFRRLIKQFILKEVFFNITKLLYPIIPFNTEDAYSHMYFLKSKKKYLGFENFSEISSLKSKLNYNLTEFQRVNYEFKSKNLLQIKNKFLYLFNVIKEKSESKNKLKDSEYDSHNKQELGVNEDNIDDKRDFANKIKYLENKRKKKLDVNLIENNSFYENKERSLSINNTENNQFEINYNQEKK